MTLEEIQLDARNRLRAVVDSKEDWESANVLREALRAEAQVWCDTHGKGWKSRHSSGQTVTFEVKPDIHGPKVFLTVDHFGFSTGIREYGFYDEEDDE